MLASCFRRFIPSHRFSRSQSATIDRHFDETELDYKSIRVLNWNIAKKNHDDDWRREFWTILARYQPNLIFLQEVRMDVDTEHAIDLGEMSWSFAPNFVDLHHRVYFGVLTAANPRPIAHQSVLTAHHEPILNTPKVSLVTEYRLADLSETLLTINSHLINFVHSAKFAAQLQELEFTLAAHRGPILFAGDFNTWNRSRAALLNQVASRLGLTPVIFAPHHDKQLKRFLFSPPLDYIFYRGLSERPASAYVLDNIASSDHKPMLVEFSKIHL